MVEAGHVALTERADLWPRSWALLCPWTWLGEEGSPRSAPNEHTYTKSPTNKRPFQRPGRIITRERGDPTDDTGGLQLVIPFPSGSRVHVFRRDRKWAHPPSG